ncbi:ABC transporter [Arthrobacter sp. StoSoilA2]|uniref:carbohydrate ABC transporter permease n=1 Tax=unclassified Arthrobacter TaxID=235627 RepID=UPI001CC77009|nr:MULTISPECIES: sugar ABC transporter permease [unclassified Arthrobacter]MDR6686097.1 raffinose/stachyose/melibiose transport system permease protein [Arthrobacter sp. 1088]BCW35508.1 ABC transporter [Arthrobacter sp. StoSoilA2]BCW51507.1 ABC transporter [Arthrobacter sp. StoSoilB13]
MSSTTTHRAATGSRKVEQAGQQKSALAWLTVPALIFFVVFALVPLVGVLVLSFANWDGIGAIGAAGLENWSSVLTDPGLYNALGLTFLIMIVSWLVQTPISLLLGVFTAGTQRYRAALAVLYFLPLLLSSAAVAIAYKALLDPNFGLAMGLGLPILAQDWLGVPQLALGLVIFVIAWQFVPFHTLIYQGGVRQIPKSLYEAAQIDGAGIIKQFFHITLPQLKYTIITSSTLMVVGSLTYFDLIFVLTGGGPGNSTRILALDMYLRGFRANLMGPASVIAVILVVIGLVLALFLQRLGGKDKQGSQLEGL